VSGRFLLDIFLEPLEDIDAHVKIFVSQFLPFGEDDFLVFDFYRAAPGAEPVTVFLFFKGGRRGDFLLADLAQCEAIGAAVFRGAFLLAVDGRGLGAERPLVIPPSQSSSALSLFTFVLDYRYSFLRFRFPPSYTSCIAAIFRRDIGGPAASGLKYIIY
jgi:hypothetical protein